MSKKKNPHISKRSSKASAEQRCRQTACSSFPTKFIHMQQVTICSANAKTEPLIQNYRVLIWQLSQTQTYRSVLHFTASMLRFEALGVKLKKYVSFFVCVRQPEAFGCIRLQNTPSGLRSGSGLGSACQVKLGQVLKTQAWSGSGWSIGDFSDSTRRQTSAMLAGLLTCSQ